MKNDYDTDLDVMFCRSYGSADDPVSCVESDVKETINFQKEKQSNTVIIEQKGELKK